MTHVFIVNETTFKVHLEYMFAGIGAKCDAPFLIDPEYHNSIKKENGVTSASERNLVGMIADISRIKEGDNIIFYVQASNQSGMFYGTFKAVGNSFYDENENNYLYDLLGKYLNFRIKIEPNKVYSKGITEYDALDSLNEIDSPYDMCWSLIYRKLKGNRGCTMITDAEADRLISLIKKRNSSIAINGEHFTYDESSKSIISTNIEQEYTGRELSLNIEKRLLVKANRNAAFESHLQAYVMQNATKAPLCCLIDIPSKDIWIGNEVSCGVGMQRIDIMTVNSDDKNIFIKVLELKSIEPYSNIIYYQLPRYIDWLKNYIVPTYSDKKVIISPIILAKKISTNNALDNFKHCCETFETINTNQLCVQPISYISFETNEGKISFEKTF